MKDELQDAALRLKRYDNIDGTGEMVMGLMLLGFGTLGMLRAALPEHSWWNKGFNGLLLMYLVLIPFMGLGRWLQRIIKRRITWPRTGYVAFQSDKRVVLPLLLAIGLGAMVIGALLGLLIASAKVDQLATHAWRTGATTAGRVFHVVFWPLLYAFWITRMGREQAWKWMVLIFMVLGLSVIVFVVPGNFFKMFGPVALYVGAIWFISGAATLALYVRYTWPPVEDAE